MFIVILRYEKSLDEVDRLMKAHVSFLEECYRSGLFVASGRQVPRTGGVILSRGSGKAEVEAVMQHDPFVQEGVARYEIIEFRTSMHHPEFASFADAETRAVSIPDA